MRFIAVTALLALTAATPALAQGNKSAPIQQPGPPQQVAPGTPASTVVIPGGETKSGPAAGAIVAPTGTGAATITTDSAAGGNSGQPARGVPQMGRGGSGGTGQ